MIGHIRPIASGVHPDRTADSPGDRAKKRQIAPRRRRRFRNLRIQRCRPGGDDIALDRDIGKGPAQPDHHGPAIRHPAR